MFELLTTVLLGLGLLAVGMAYSRNEFAPTQGDEEFIFSAPESATVISIGDWVYQDPTTRAPKCAADMLDQGSETLNQDAFQQYFLGVAEQASAAGQTSKIRIATKGRKHVDVAAGEYHVGDLLGMAEASSGTALERRKLKAAITTGGLTYSRAVARVCEEPASTAATGVWVEFRSTIMHGGLQATVLGSSSGAV